MRQGGDTSGHDKMRGREYKERGAAWGVSGGARQRTGRHATLPWVGPRSVSGVLNSGDRMKNAGVGLGSNLYTFWERFCRVNSSNTCKEHFISIYECKTTNGSRWNSEMQVTGSLRWCFPGRACDRRLSPSRSSVTLPLQFSHRFFALVVSCLAPTAIYGKLLAGAGTPVGGRGARERTPWYKQVR